MWKNYGDVNFFEHGGCQVKPAYSKEDIEKFPLLKSIFHVFYLVRDGDLTIGALCTVDVDNPWSKIPQVLTAIGLEENKDIEYGGLSPDELACELVEFFGIQEFHPTFYNDKFRISDYQLREWMDCLGIKTGENEQLLDWLSRQDQACEDIQNFFGKDIEMLTPDQISSWLARPEHKQLAEDYMWQFR